MSIYFDLTILFNLLLSMVSLYFIKLVSLYRAKRRFYPLLFIIESTKIYLIYYNFYLIFIGLLIIYLGVFFLLYRLKFIKAFLLYVFCFYGIQFISVFLFDSVKLFKGFFIISSPSGIKVFLMIPLVFISLFLSQKTIDFLFHLRSFKTKCFITLENKKFYVSAYYDTGNTLKVNNIPVVFINKKIIPIDEKIKYEEICITTVNKNSIEKAYRALISIAEKKEEYFVYLIPIDKESFNDCECLLNAYMC